MTAPPFVFTRQGRSTRTAVVVLCVYAGLATLIVVFQAAWWVVTPLALTTLPALWDLWKNPSAGLRLDDRCLTWHTGRRQAELVLSEIDHMRFDTRLDLSVRVSAVLTNDKRIRLPYECLPPHMELEQALQDRGVAVTRHHFSFF